MTKHFFSILLLAGAFGLIVSCKKDEPKKNITPPKVCAKDMAISYIRSHTDYTRVDFSSTSSGYDFTTYKWTFGDGNSSVDPKPTHYYSAEGTYNIKLLAVTTCGDTVSKDTTATISSVYVYKFKCDTINYTLNVTGESPLNVAQSGEFGDPNGSREEYLHTAVGSSNHLIKVMSNDPSLSFDRGMSVQIGDSVNYTAYGLPPAGSYPISKLYNYATAFYNYFYGIAGFTYGGSGQITVSRSDTVFVAQFNVSANALSGTATSNCQGSFQVSRYKHYY